jgi:hypothetical protein
MSKYFSECLKDKLQKPPCLEFMPGITLALNLREKLLILPVKVGRSF